MSIEELKKRIFVGVVEDNNDPKRLGRCRIRVNNVFDELPVEDIPWSTPWKDLSGHEFDLPPVGKVMAVIFDNGNPYKPEYIYAKHFNANLEKKLTKVSEEDYLSFSSVHFDEMTQIYRNKSEGLKIDHEYTNINLDKNGNINLNLRDNDAKVLIGSPDSAQAAILGTSFMAWMDTLVDNLLGENGGPYLGNLGAPVIANPALIQCLIEYRLSRDPKFLSERVWIVDNKEVKSQKRDYDNTQGDNWKSTVKENNLTKSSPVSYAPPDSPVTGRPEVLDPSIPNDIHSQTITSEASMKTVNVSNYDNGQIPLDKMKKNKFLSKSLGGDSSYLMSEASDSLDALMNAFNNASFKGKQSITFTDGYRSLQRQEAMFAKYGQGRAAKPGTSNHGWGIAIDIYWGIRTNMFKDIDSRPSAFKHPNYIWFFENGPNFGWFNPTKLRDDSKTDEWWHWEYHGKSQKQVILVSRYKGDFTEDDISNIKKFGGTFNGNIS